MASGKQRFFIVGTGRSGSSLLAAILADAGAVFDIPRRESWNPGSGAYEHPLIISARRWQSRMRKIDESLLPNRLGYRFCYRRMTRDLDTLLRRALFVKSSDLYLLVHHAKHLGYAPSIIVSYRDFNRYARSRFLRSGNTLGELIERYRNTYGTAALQLQTFGGCVVSYDDLVDSSEVGWIEAVATVTGLPQEAILRARAQRVRVPRAVDRTPLFDYVFSRLSGRVVAPDIDS